MSAQKPNFTSMEWNDLSNVSHLCTFAPSSPGPSVQNKSENKPEKKLERPEQFLVGREGKGKDKERCV